MKSLKNFQKTFPGEYKTIYVPCCGFNVSPSKAFPNSKIIYVDKLEIANKVLKEKGYEIYNKDVNDFQYTEKRDFVFILNPQVEHNVLVKDLKEGGIVSCNEYHGTASDLMKDENFEFIGIGRDKIVSDKKELDTYQEEITTDEEWKQRDYYMISGMHFGEAKELVEAVFGTSKNVLEHYMKMKSEPDIYLPKIKEKGVLRLLYNEEIFKSLPKKIIDTDNIYYFRKIKKVK